MNSNIRKALGALSALFVVFSYARANDGLEFSLKRSANRTDGKMLSAEDVVYGYELYPKSERNYYGRKASKTIAFTSADALYVINSANDTVKVAQEGDGIVYGKSVSRNEFGISGGIFVSPDSSKVAFYRKDESKVALYPLHDLSATNGALKSIRYPMAGCASEKIRIGVFDRVSGETVYLKTDRPFGEDQYLTNVCWSPDNSLIYIQVLDRQQQNMVLNSYNAISGDCVTTLLIEHSDTWVEPQAPLRWMKGSKNLAIYTTDNRDGYWSLYLLNTDKSTLKRITCIDRDARYVANDGRNVFFTAPDEHPVNNYLYKVDTRTLKITRLSREEGWHSIDMADDCKSFVDVYQRLDLAPVSRLCSAKDGKVIKELVPSVDPTLEYAYTEISMGTVTSANGIDRNYYRMIKPLDFDPSKKYPLILYVYGGPHSQMVSNVFLGGLRRWEMYMAQRGYVVFVMDGRGTQRHGAKYEHSIYRQCGVNEMADQMEAVNMLRNIPWIDADRIGVYGWSYGGFMSLTLSTNHNDIFKVCVAGGPVIDWRWYEVMYGERYMSTPELNPEGYARTSLVAKAKDVKAKTLVIEGGNDDTVVPHHALSFIQACVDEGVEIEYFTYPKAGHNMRGKDRVHLVEKVSNHFIRNL